MNGLIKNGVVCRSWIARHGPDTARAGNERRPVARGDRNVCMLDREREYVTHSC